MLQTFSSSKLASVPDNLLLADMNPSPADDSFASQQQDSLDGAEDSGKRSKRRSKKDKTDRNFVCGCGKQYLSYPALYTHVKTKHNGLQPVGTKSNLSQKNKRGRPKKLEIRNDIELGAFDENSTIPSFPNGLLNRLITENNLAHKSILEKIDLPYLKIYGFSGKSDPTLGFPVITVCNGGKAVFHPFHTIINHLKTNNTTTTFATKNPCFDVVISLFLYYLSRLVNEKFYLVLIIMFRNLRQFLNEQGYDIIIKGFQNNFGQRPDEIIARKKENKPFCEYESCEYLPLVAEEFIGVYLPAHCPEFEQHLAVDALYDFCNWLLKKKFTKVRIQFRDEQYNIDK